MAIHLSFRFRCWSIAFIFLALGSACKHDIPLPENPNPQPPGNGGSDTTTSTPCHPDTVYYQQTIQPLLLSSCAYAGCHDAISATEGVILSSYEKVMQTSDVRPFDLAGSDLYEVITETDPDKRMPWQLPPLAAADIENIRRWIMQGARNTSCSDCDTTSVSYAQVIGPLVQSRCLNCHNGPNGVGGRELSSYSSLKAAAETTNLLDRINDRNGANVMPQGGQMPACDINKIEKWVAQNFPQ